MTILPPICERSMLRGATRLGRFAVPGIALLLGFALAPKAVRADDECGVASKGVATCTADTGNLGNGVRYLVTGADGLALTIEERTGGTARRIEIPPTVTDLEDRNGILVRGSHGSGAGLRLAVHGDTNLVVVGGRENSNDGILIRNGNGSSDRPVSGSVTVDIGAEVDISTSDLRFRRYGIHAIIEAGPADATASNAGIRITNAGTVFATDRGIRALGYGYKIASPAANHLNGRIEIRHSGSITAGNWGIHAVSERNADVVVAVEEDGTVNASEGIYAESKGAAGPGGSGDIAVTSAGAITATSGRGIDARVTSGMGTLGVTTTGGTITATDVGIHTTSATGTGATDIMVGASSSVTGNVHGIHANHTGSAEVTVNVAGMVAGGDDAGEAAIKIEAADVETTIEANATITGAGGIFAEADVADSGGDITVTSAGAITAMSERGIDARVTSGTGILNVTTTAGTITAAGTGIHTTSGNDAGAANIRVASGSSVTGGVHGIHANHTGSAEVTVNVAGMVAGGDDADEAAIKIEAAGAASVTLTDEFSINGDIVFDGNDENDTLTLAVGRGMRGEVMGDVAMVDSLVKNGRGEAWLGGDVTFAGSTVAINDGVLILRGHVDLGNDGTLTVAKGKRLMIEVGANTGDHGKVTAGTITLAGETPVYVTLDDDARAAAAGQLNNGITVFEGNAAAEMEGVAVTFFRYSSVTENAVGANGRIRANLTSLEPEPKPEPGLPGGGGSGSGSGGGGSGGAALLVVGGGALAYLLWDLGLFDDEALLGGEGSGGQFGTLTHSFSSTRSGIPSSDKGIEYRMRLLEPATPAIAAILPASGVATSLRAHLGDGFHADLTGTPNLAAGFGRDSLSGSRYGLGMGWRSGRFSTDIGYSHATLRARSTFSNLEGLGALSGQYGLRHDRVQANAKLRLAAARLSVSPSLSLFEGTVAQDGFTASSPVWLSEVPAISQDYRGWKADLSLAPRSPLKAMGLRWRPELRLMTTQFASGSSSQTVIEQRDRTGALRLDTPAQASLPRTVHAFGGGLTVAGGKDWALRGGYAALLADGAIEHAAGAQLRMRF